MPFAVGDVPQAGASGRETVGFVRTFDLSGRAPFSVVKRYVGPLFDSRGPVTAGTAVRGEARA
ncbi:hypothetical protein [Streptomyces sp. NPDC003247]|uniref:hypothetical protein n=1 Tax=Streptomyces sp. NPDC003247 TaxID=3364677 RepID=UPI0036BFABB5